VFLHITSLPSLTGIGNFGAAVPFIDFLADSGFKYWQICPAGPTGYGDSPYQSFSAFAGNPYFIDLEELLKLGFLFDFDLAAARTLPQDRCDYGRIYEIIPPLFKIAYKNFACPAARAFAEKHYGLGFKNFCLENAYWLNSYAYFTALKKRHGGAPWYKWEASQKSYKEFLRGSLKADPDFSDECECVKFTQWLYHAQLKKLKAYASAKSIEIIGDMPIFLSYDSADVWERPELFDLDKDFAPNNIAGVGPDYFCAEGQLWGNPLYNWEGKKVEVYEFWRLRLAKEFEFADVIRLDHFRGFADYWAIPFKTQDARLGVWKTGPGADFFEYLRKAFPKGRFLAEDLGLLSPRAEALRDSLKIPAMAVLQFAFGGDAKNAYLPHNHKANCACYTGTHDNDTSKSWYETSADKVKDHFRRYYRVNGSCPHLDLTHSAMLSVCFLAIIPAQDLLGLGGEARMNVPGRAAGNWQWRMRAQELENLRGAAGCFKSSNILGGRFGDVTEYQGDSEK